MKRISREQNENPMEIPNDDQSGWVAAARNPKICKQIPIGT